jgi:hypothetical protein
MTDDLNVNEIIYLVTVCQNFKTKYNLKPEHS